MPPTAIAGYTLSRATLLDTWRIRRLEKAIFPKDAYSVPELALQFLLPRARNYKLASDETGQVAGFVSGLDPLLPGRPAWIMTIGVAEDHRQQGLGRFLLDYVETKLRAARIRLTVRAGNAAAIRLYQAAGYTYLRRHLRYYLDGEDGLIYEKQR